MKIIKILFPVLISSVVCFLLADEKFRERDKFIVRKIVFIGNVKTKSEVIARELTFTLGSRLDTSEIELNENRIYGMGLFNKVKIWFEKDSTSTDSINVYVWVNERWYIWPFPVFGWKDRDIKKLYYGAGLIHTNFRGRNEKLIFSFALGYDPWIEIEYLNPWILGSNNLFYSIELSYQRIKNKSKILEEGIGTFYEDIFIFNFLLGKRIWLYKKIWADVGFKNIATTGEATQLKTISPTGVDKILVVGAGFKYDTRDIPVYPNGGILLNFLCNFNQILNYKSFFIQSGLEFQLYQKVWVGLIAGRFFILNSIGQKIPVYSHFYFGYEERIRGYFNEIFEGENILGGMVEYRIPLMKQKFLKLEKAPLEEFSILRFGVDFIIFGDIGRTWFNNEKFFSLTFWKGYGLGLNFLLPYDLILSLAFAKNQKGKGQFILDFKGNF